MTMIVIFHSKNPNSFWTKGSRMMKTNTLLVLKISPAEPCLAVLLLLCSNSHHINCTLYILGRKYIKKLLNVVKNKDQNLAKGLGFNLEFYQINDSKKKSVESALNIVLHYICDVIPSWCSVKILRSNKKKAGGHIAAWPHRSTSGKPVLWRDCREREGH